MKRRLSKDLHRIWTPEQARHVRHDRSLLKTATHQDGASCWLVLGLQRMMCYCRFFWNGGSWFNFTVERQSPGYPAGGEGGEGDGWMVCFFQMPSSGLRLRLN